MTFISRIVYFRITGEVLNLRTNVPVVLMAVRDPLLARTLNSGGIKFAKIKFSRIFPDLQ